MPTYEYHCKKCGTNFEIEQRMTDDALKTHDDCGGDLAKVFSSAGIVLKGSGFYKTDARSGSASKKPASPGSVSGTNSSNSSESTQKPNSTEKKTESAKPKEASKTAPKQD